MANPYVGEIRMFGGNFAPAGWAFCDGSLLPIAGNDVLFQLIGTTYGGDGTTTFALPNLAGRAPVHMGTNPGTGTAYTQGQLAGVETVTLTLNQIPVHSHPILADDNNGATTGTDPTNHLYGNTNPTKIYSNHTGALKQMMTTRPDGGSQPHSNLQPFLAVSFIISLFGIFPSAT